MGADLAGSAEFVRAEAIGRSCDERHVSGNTGKTHTRSEAPADQ
jgi:hypothetical protein